MNCRDITRWMGENSQSCTEAGISPVQAVALCRWKLSDRVDRDGWTGLPLLPSWKPEGAFDYPVCG
jgi:hypothetical protein